MKILICQFGNETNTFKMGLNTFEQLAPDGWTRAEDVLPTFTGTSTYLGGALRAIAEEGATPVTMDIATMGGNFGAGALMAGECATYVMDTVCQQIKARLGQFDAIFFALHGGGSCEFDEDLEGYTLQRLREVVGPDMLIMSSMDLHANVTPKMVELSNGLFCIKEVPHNDCVDAGYRAAKHLIRTLRGEIKPMMCLKRLPILVTPSAGSTMSGPAKAIKDHFAAYCAEHNLLDASFVHGFSGTDRACSSASILVVADGYVPEQEAAELAQWVWDRHETLTAPSLTAEEAVTEAWSKVKDGYVVINEASDNPGSGGTGDTVHLLRELLRRNQKRTIMGPIYDKETAELLHNHKVGDIVHIRLGGKIHPIGGESVECDAEILNLSNGKFVSYAPINCGMPMNYGKSARIAIGNVECIVVSNLFQVYDDHAFTMTGADMTQYSIVGLKSMNHFRGFYTSHSDAIVTADTPGMRPSNLKLNPYQHVIRPIFPLDDDVTYDGVWPKK